MVTFCHHFLDSCQVPSVRKLWHLASNKADLVIPFLWGRKLRPREGRSLCSEASREQVAELRLHRVSPSLE